MRDLQGQDTCVLQFLNKKVCEKIPFFIYRPAKPSDKDHVKIIKDPKYCTLSIIGRRGGLQTIRFNTDKSDCYNLQSVIHEFIHTIGFHHEHNR